MKIIFLDVDGVLNSMKYYENVDIIKDPLDLKCIDCLKKIVDETNAKIVLSSSWRGGWSLDSNKCGYQGKVLNETLNKFNLEIFDCTESLNYNDGMSRSREIKKWILDSPYKIESFLIIDDNDFGWKKAGFFYQWIQPSFLENGLERKHIKKSVNILNKRNLKIYFRKIIYKIIRK